jgi:type IV fimbrial biogenesis protein FimT
MLVTHIIKSTRTCGATRMKQDRRSRVRGFTLIEMMVTVGIAVILLGIGMPSFTSFIRNQAVKTASFDLSSALVLARSEAIKRNADVVIAAATGGWQNGWTVTAGTTTLSNREAVSGLTITGPASSVTYLNNGRVQGTAPEFEISGSSSNRCIRVTLSGHPNSTKGTCP